MKLYLFTKDKSFKWLIGLQRSQAVRTYCFEARSADGQMIAGELDAKSEAEAFAKLRNHQLTPQTVKLKPQSSFREFLQHLTRTTLGARVKPKDLQAFTRQFATMVKSGIPIVDCLEALRSGAIDLDLKNILDQVLIDLRHGLQLHQAMAKHPKAFNRLYISLVRAGEEGGVLDTVLDRLAAYSESTVRIRSKVMGALYYPAAILIVATLVTTAILTYMVPAFVDIFASNGLEMPWVTQVVVAISNDFTAYWHLYIGAVIAVLVVGKVYYGTDGGRIVTDSFVLDVPVLGTLIQKSAAAHVSHTMAILLSAGVRVLDAMEMAAQTADNYVIQASILDGTEALKNGNTLADSLKSRRGVPEMLVQMIRVGEYTGGLDLMFDKASEFYEADVENTIEASIKLIDPILVVVLGAVIGFVVVAMYLPIFQAANIAL